jgi:hypothetical protein
MTFDHYAKKFVKHQTLSVAVGEQKVLLSAKQYLAARIHELDPRVRVVLLLGAKQTGKTEGAAWAMLYQILSCPYDEFLILAPTYKKLDDATMKKFLELCEMIPGLIVTNATPGAKKRSSEQRARLVMANGSVVYYRSADKLSGLEGMTLRAAWVDEAQYIDREIVEEIRFNRLRIKNGMLYLTAALLKQELWQDHYLEEYRQKALAGDDEILYIPFSVYDLKGLKDRRTGRDLFDEELLERKRKSMDEESFRMYILGEVEDARRDDSLFPHKLIQDAVARWPEKFARLPERLYAFFAERARTLLGEDEIPKRTDPPDAIDLIVIGVDVAEFGGDNICVSYRHGRTVYWVENWGAMGLLELEERLVSLYNELSAIVPCMMVIDEGGIGKGIPIHLIDKGVDARGVFYGEHASDPAYASLKTELYFRLKEWLVCQEPPLVLPPIPALIYQMSTTKYSVSEEKKRLLIVKPRKSPDELDSVILGLVAGDGSANIFF